MKTYRVVAQNKDGFGIWAAFKCKKKAHLKSLEWARKLPHAEIRVEIYG